MLTAEASLIEEFRLESDLVVALSCGYEVVLLVLFYLCPALSAREYMMTSVPKSKMSFCSYLQITKQG